MMKLSLYTILSTCASFFCCTNKSVSNTINDSVKWHLGHIKFQLPDNIILKNATYSINYVDIKLDIDSVDSFETYWKQYLKEIESKKQSRELEDDKQGEIVAVKEISPELKTIIFHEYDNPEVISCALVKATKTGIIKLQIDGDLDKQHIWYQNILDLIKDYSETNNPINNAFCLHKGYFLPSFKFRKEEIDIKFVDTINQRKLKIFTSSYEEKEDESLFDKGMKLWTQKLGLTVFNIKTLRETKRVVAGQKGYELIISDPSNKRNKLYFVFHAKGEAQSVTKPEIKIEMETNGLSKEQDFIVWDNLLNSMH